MQSNRLVEGFAWKIMRSKCVYTFWRINSIKVKYNKLRALFEPKWKKNPPFVCYDQTHHLQWFVAFCGFSYELHALQNYSSRFANYHTLDYESSKCSYFRAAQTPYFHVIRIEQQLWNIWTFDAVMKWITYFQE